jgi:hypothetical protein
LHASLAGQLICPQRVSSAGMTLQASFPPHEEQVPHVVAVTLQAAHWPLTHFCVPPSHAPQLCVLPSMHEQFSLTTPLQLASLPAAQVSLLTGPTEPAQLFQLLEPRSADKTQAC